MVKQLSVRAHWWGIRRANNADLGEVAIVTKVVIQIPCYNEEHSLPAALRDLPRYLPEIGRVEWLVVNDGSTDRTSEVARELGVDHVIELTRNQGLARAFMAGLEGSLAAGADIIVNTDADNQYCAADIPKLLAPILQGEADIVAGARPVSEIEHFSPLKKLLQRLGSRAVKATSGTDVEDAPSGFRAITREAALRMRVFTNYTYTLETLIQAGRNGLRVRWVPVRVNGPLRPSRLVKSNLGYVLRGMLTILRVFALYKPLRFFFYLGCIPFAGGVVLSLRWLYLRIFEMPLDGRTHVPSLVIAGVLLLIGFQLWVFAFVADLLAANRSLLEEIAIEERRKRALGVTQAKGKSASASL